MSRIVRIGVEINPKNKKFFVGLIFALSKELDQQNAEPTGRKLEINIELYRKIYLELQAHEALSSYEIIVSTQCPYLKMWGKKKSEINTCS